MASVSIKDVAARAGVSVGTVSNVLNRPGNVRPATRARVEAAVADLGFVEDVVEAVVAIELGAQLRGAGADFGRDLRGGPALARGIVSGFGVDTICSVGTDLFSEMRLALAAERSRANAPALARGERVPTVDLHPRDMLRLALMSSENRAASALSRSFPGGQSAFIQQMNLKAHALHMTDTHFDDPPGLSPDNVSTARDVARMANAASHYPIISSFTTLSAYEQTIGSRIRSYHNTDPVVRWADWDVQLAKTGYTREAGLCIVVDVAMPSGPVIIALLGARTSGARAADRWALGKVPDATRSGPGLSVRRRHAGQPRPGGRAVPCPVRRFPLERTRRSQARRRRRRWRP